MLRLDVRSEVTPDATPVEHNSAPNHDARIDSLTAFGACGDAHRNLSLLAEWTDVSVEEQLDFSTQGCPALRAGRVSELEVPPPITFGAAVVRDDLNLAIDHALLGRRVAVSLVRRFALGGRETNGQQWEGVRSILIEDLNAYVQVHGISRTDCLAQTGEDCSELVGVQKLIEQVADLVKDRICGLERRLIHMIPPRRRCASHPKSLSQPRISHGRDRPSRPSQVTGRPRKPSQAILALGWIV
jgi:hypothetical protein